MSLTGHRLDSRINRFWMGVVIAVIAIGAIGTLQARPALLHSTRGLLLAALIVADVAWYLLVGQLLAYMRRCERWPALPRYLSYPALGVGLALAAALLSYNLSFSGVVYVVIGMSVALLPWPESLIAVGAAVLLYLHAINVLPLFLTPGHLGDLALSLFSIAMGIGISYTLSALYRQRGERDRLIAELQEAQRRLRASAARDAELAALRERNRLAREMHDSLGHALVLIAIKIEAAQRLQAVNPERATAEWEDTKALVRTAMADLRNSLAGLRLPALEEQPLHEALAALVGETSRRTGVEVACVVDEECSSLAQEAQEALYRVGQEALANVAKHAHARHAALSLHLRDGTALLEVSDDGVGLGATPRGGGHYGVLGMRERVEALGGILTLGPRPEGGTVLRASVPVHVAESVGTGALPVPVV